MSEEEYSNPEFTQSTFIQSAPTNDQDVYINIVQEVMANREGVVDAMLLDDINTLWDQYVNRPERKQ